MGLFNKKEENKGIPSLPNLPKLPELPELPSLPDFPTFENSKEDNSSKQIHQLPSFPNNSFASKFSQNTIKDAISGQKEGEEEEVDDFEFPMKAQRIQPPLKRIPLSQPISMNTPSEKRASREAEPIFIRIDKFEEAMKIFDETKSQISKIEILLEDTRELKEKEDVELQEWTKEIQKIKNQIEKVDKDIFSKL